MRYFQNIAYSKCRETQVSCSQEDVNEPRNKGSFPAGWNLISAPMDKRYQSTDLVPKFANHRRPSDGEFKQRKKREDIAEYAIA
jgi:hypothetical protein